MPARSLTTWPRLVAFEVTTRCNLACAMCLHGVKAITDPADADMALTETLWPALEAAETVHLNGVGEPLLAAPFWRIVERLRGRDTPRISFNTNGLMLSGDNLARLAQAPLGRVSVSLDAATAQTYERIRGGSFEKALDGTRRLARLFGAAAEVVITFVVMRENAGEMAAFVDLAAALGVGIVRFGPLTEPPLPASDWRVERPGGWVFCYGEQQLRPSDPHLAEGLAAALARGAALGITVEDINLRVWE